MLAYLRFLEGFIVRSLLLGSVSALYLNALVNLGSDVIALQEIYSDVHRRYLSSEVRGVYPFYAPLQRDRVHGLENGLMTHERPDT